MLTDPQTITINAVEHWLPKISQGQESATYRNGDATVILRTSHQHNKGRTRSMFRVDQVKVAADPLTAENVQLSTGIYLVIDKPDVGFSSTELTNLVTGIVTALSGTSYALFKKLIANES